jgi:hypothetical protein
VNKSIGHTHFMVLLSTELPTEPGYVDLHQR